MMIQAVLSNPSHPEYGVATIPFPIPRDQYTYCMELLAALEIGDAVKTDCKVEKIDSFYTRRCCGRCRGGALSPPPAVSWAAHAGRDTYSPRAVPPFTDAR